MNKSANFSGQPIFKQILSFIHRGLIYRTAHRHGSDRYYKSFKTYNHLVTMLFATVSGMNSLPELSGVMLPAKSKACTPQRKWVYSNMVFIKWYNLINYINLFNSDPTDLNRLLWFSRTPLKNNPNRILLLKTRNSTARSHSSPNRPQSIVAGLGNPCKPCLEDCLQKWNIEASFFSI